MSSRCRFKAFDSPYKVRHAEILSNGKYFWNQCGVGLIEVVISMAILAMGLLGLAALQGKSQKAELESFQRTQALLLAEDMAERLRSAGTAAAADYVGEVGFNSAFNDLDSCNSSAAGPIARDLSCWHRELMDSDGDQLVGGLIGGHGCITALGGGLYRVSVSWQGLTPLAITEPLPADTCGKNLYSEETLRTINLTVSFYP